MTVTRLEKVKDTRWKVEVDGEYWNILDAEIIVKYHLKPGAEVDEQTLAAALRAAEYRRARERAENQATILHRKNLRQKPKRGARTPQRRGFTLQYPRVKRNAQRRNFP